MPYASLDNLSRFHGRMRGRASAEFASLDMANWQKTAAAGAVSFSPVPEMPLDPVVNFLFSETGPAEGTKGPDNPSTIAGVSSVKVTRCGKNLVPPPSNGTAVRNGVTFVVADGVFAATGTAGSGNAALYIANATVKDLRVVQGHTYCLSGCPAGGTSSTYYINANIYDSNGNAIAYNVLRDYGSGATYTAPSNGWLTVYIGVVSGVEVSGLVFKPQIEDSASATVFEPSESTVYTIDLGGTFYGGSVDLSTGVMTVTQHMVVLDSTTAQGFDYYGNDASGSRFAARLGRSSYLPSYRNIDSFVSSHFNGSVSLPAVFGNFNLYSIWFTIADSNNVVSDPNATAAENKQAFLNWLDQKKSSGSPVVFTYDLYTPYTVQLTPTQIYSLSQPDPYAPRVNTVYSDQVSVQAGYPKPPQATQNELTSAVVSLGGNV